MPRSFGFGQASGHYWSRLANGFFLSKYWEKRWLRVEGSARGIVEDLVDLQDLEQLLFDKSGSTHPVLMVGDFLSPKGNGLPDPGENPIEAWFQGKTLIFQNLERRLPKIAALVRRWEIDLSCPIRCNLYLTPPSARGFQAHYDPHDVFIMQITGDKEWRIGARAITMPLPDQTWDSASAPIDDGAENFRLRQGDLLYIPSGFLHSAQSVAEISCHITFGILAPRYLDLIIASATAAARRDPDLRRQLRTGAPVDFKTLSNLLARIGAADAQAALEQIREKTVAQQPPPTEGLLGMIKRIESLADDDGIRVDSSALFWLSQTPTGIELSAFGRTVSLPARLEAALRYCLSGQRFTIAEIPGEVSLEDKRLLVRRLLMQRILILSDDSQSC